MYPMPVGKGYKGEIEGLIYDYTSDRYIPDPKKKREFEERQGLRPAQPEPASTWDQVKPVVAGAATMGLLNYGGETIVSPFWEGTVKPYLTQGYEWGRGMLTGEAPYQGHGGYNASGQAINSSQTYIQGDGSLASMFEKPANYQGPIADPTPVAAQPTATPVNYQGSGLLSQGGYGNEGFTSVSPDMGYGEGYQSTYGSTEVDTAFSGSSPDMGYGEGGYSTGNAAATGASDFSNMSTLGQGATIAAGVMGAYSHYEHMKDWGKIGARNTRNVGGHTLRGASEGAAVGGMIGSMVLPGGGTAVGAMVGGIIGAVVGFARGMVRAGRHKDHSARSQFRDGLREAGFADNINNEGKESPGTFVRLADGTKYDISGERGEANYTPKIGAEERTRQQGDILTMANTLGQIMTAGNDKLGENFGGYFFNAVTSQGAENELKNMRALYRKAGIVNKKAAYAVINDLLREGDITEEEAIHYQTGLNYVFDPNYAPGDPVTGPESDLPGGA
jgi:hypothetical protein